jgi:hypothetical protein
VKNVVKDDAPGTSTMESLSDGPAAVEKAAGSRPTGERQVNGAAKEGKKVVVDLGRENQDREQPATKATAKVSPPAAKVAPAAAKTAAPPAAAPKAAHLPPEEPVKAKKAVAADNKGGKGAINVQPPAVKEAIADKNQMPADQLLQKRLAAGSAWTKKAKEDGYTMQLMVLTDKNAEDHLKKMLTQPHYRQEAGKFYIFRKSASSPVLFVFYGEYPTLAQAREAQKNLPAALQVHQPYAIPIKGALEKVKK